MCRPEWKNHVDKCVVDGDCGSRTVVGPFFGEFGWECMYWQGWCRRTFAGSDVVVACRPGSRDLYNDWCDSFLTIDGPVFDMNGPDVPVKCGRQYAPSACGAVYRKPLIDQTFRHFDRLPEPGRVCVLTRWRPGHNHSKDREPGWYMDVVGDSARVDFVVRDEVGEAVDALSRCEVAIGPEGGRIKLALLVGVPVITWGPFREEDRVRDEAVWGSHVFYFGTHVRASRVREKLYSLINKK